MEVLGKLLEKVNKVEGLNNCLIKQDIFKFIFWVFMY